LYFVEKWRQMKAVIIYRPRQNRLLLKGCKNTRLKKDLKFVRLNLLGVLLIKSCFNVLIKLLKWPVAKTCFSFLNDFVVVRWNFFKVFGLDTSWFKTTPSHALLKKPFFFLTSYRYNLMKLNFVSAPTQCYGLFYAN